MVENLLSVTRIDSGQVQIIKSPTVLDELIDSVMLKFKKRYFEQKVEIDLPEEVVIIPMDAILIEQVIVNILENAVQHAKGMTRLELRVFVQGKHAVFEIQDNGCGIDDKHLETLFSGYYISDNEVIDSQKKNAGIGLSVCATRARASRALWKSCARRVWTVSLWCHCFRNMPPLRPDRCRKKSWRS